MDSRVADFIRNHAQNLVGLDVALFFQANPQTFDTARAIAARTHRDIQEVTAALDRLVEAGVLELHSRGEGKYRCYTLAKNPTNWNLLCMITEAYVDDLEQRKEIVRLIIGRRGKDSADGDTEAGPGRAEQ